MDISKNAAKAEANGAARKLTLLANGTSGPWDISIDEGAAAPARYFAQIEGPCVYLYVELPSLRVIAHLVQFPAVREPKTVQNAERNNTIRLGVLGRTPVHLTWDTEYADRCFLIVRPNGKANLRVTFASEEIGHLAESLRQVVADLEAARLL